jgi:hypothetical protein
MERVLRVNRTILGAVSALVLVGAGFFWWQGRAALERDAPPAQVAAPPPAEVDLPKAEPHGAGDALPTAVTRKVSKDQARFNRFDRNRDGTILRNEMLSTRVKAFQKLDVNHDNLLNFEEWAVKTANRFKEIDANGDGIVNATELKAYYAAQDTKKAEHAKACSCGKAGPAAKGKGQPEADEED